VATHQDFQAEQAIGSLISTGEVKGRKQPSVSLSRIQPSPSPIIIIIARHGVFSKARWTHHTLVTTGGRQKASTLTNNPPYHIINIISREVSTTALRHYSQPHHSRRSRLSIFHLRVIDGTDGHRQTASFQVALKTFRHRHGFHGYVSRRPLLCFLLSGISVFGIGLRWLTDWYRDTFSVSWTGMRTGGVDQGGLGGSGIPLSLAVG